MECTYFYGMNENEKCIYFYGTKEVLVLNEIWVEWISEMWDPITIYSKSKPKLLFANELK